QTYGSSWAMVMRDYVRNLGSSGGGRHAGQLLPGSAVNWCDLAQFDGGNDQARTKGKGASVQSIAPHGQLETAFGNGAIALDGSYFSMSNGHSLPCQPRRTYYSGGLAAYFELSGAMKSNQM